MIYIAHVRKNGDQQKLSEHLLGVASLASGNAAKLDLAMVGELLGILHDLGKYSTEFQIYLKSAVGLLNQDEGENYVDASMIYQGSARTVTSAHTRHQSTCRRAGLVRR
ncbi:hypothetical protein [Propionivibrio sp.]|uniref:hypothetical protein n=1 Tax=Propionivibrio sp. TaxID=2212460 RepID=UPI0025EA471D|nr:hypothetical protein [Propionivibrio sp.]MBK7355135.1 hypothetical protein [Propionivibrio sp.]MBK8399526.1 hypothetical protein [Propionivibrio sp.]MBK8745328.1 hypothetical protein [Propionivibrio sp.]MBK8893314.1 hypothetical protein [Propionivibrio sp.]MBL0208495.1 hypothetical protein [Propionivibrio sp.]